MAQTLTVTNELVYKICPVCGCAYAIPARLDEYAQQHGSTFYCPNGHSLAYGSENERLKKELKQVQAEKWSALCKLSTVKQKAEALEKRIANGVCPCCKRNFQNLNRHLKTKHPRWPAE